MKKNIFTFALFFSICTCLFSSCGKKSDAQANENETDSLTTIVDQKIETDTGIKKITFEILADSGGVQLVKGEKESPVASFASQILVVTEVPQQSNLDSIQAILQRQQKYEGDAKEALAKKKKEYFDFYIDANSDEVVVLSAEWYQHEQIQVLYNDNYFVSILFYGDEYGGGAGSYDYASYLVLDLKNNKKITLSDLFDEEGISKIQKGILNKALQYAKEQGSTSLEEHGYFMESLKPTEDFVITEKGIEFTYGRGEILPRVNIPPVFLFSWAELKDILKTDSSVRSLIK